MIDLHNGDCLEIMKSIPDGSIDCIITDPPYGTTKGMVIDGWNEKTTQWDDTLDNSRMWSEVNRVLRVNGCCVLFSQEPYTSDLITTCHNNVPFSYRMMWDKKHFANHLLAKKAPVSYFEDVCVFFKKHDCLALHPLRGYFKQVLELIGSKAEIIKKIGGKADHVTRINSTQFELCTEQTYNELIQTFGIDKMQGFKTFAELENINRAFNIVFNRVFNLHDGKKYKSNILSYAKESERFHPTQKPVLLLEDLIKTFSNENNTVLDFTMGSGSTGVACLNTNRRFIGIELDKGYFDIAQKRINEHESQLEACP